MPRVLQAATGQTSQVDSVTGPTSYDSSSGVVISTDLIRVDRASVEIDTGDDSTTAPWEARVDSISSDNQIHARVFSQASGNEAQSGTTDLSTFELTYRADRL